MGAPENERAAACGRGLEADGATRAVMTAQARTRGLEELLRCPICRGELVDQRCADCGQPFNRIGNQYRFVDISVDSRDAQFQQETQNNTTLLGRLFNAGRVIISSEYRKTNHLETFLAEKHDLVIELGSGSRRLSQDVINIDLFPSTNVDIVADIAAVPLKDACAEQVVLASVIEHVADPSAIVHEAWRLLKPGGRLYIEAPFIFPYHGYPGHYQNFSRDGLEYLLRDFSNVKIWPALGPMTVWVNLTAEIFAVIVGGDRGLRYVLARSAALIPIFWLKYFDAFITRLSRSHRISGTLCAVATR